MSQEPEQPPHEHPEEPSGGVPHPVEPPPAPQMDPRPNFLRRTRYRLYQILEAGRTHDWPSRIFDYGMVILILANVVAFTLETSEDFSPAVQSYLHLLNVVSIAIFTVEYLLRIWVCVEHPPLRHLPKWHIRLRWVLSPAMLIDLAVILPFYLSMLFAMDLRILRILRMFRFLKLGRYSPALETLGRVIYSERRSLFGALVIMISLLITASAAMYGLEHQAQPDKFGSVPQAMWWAIATLTTVGYGDAVPITPLGRILGGLVMIFGLAMFALPIAIVSSGFANQIHRREFVVNWGMVARVPLFSQLDATAIADLASLLEAHVAQPGAIIRLRGEPVDALYFILSGKVRMELDEDHIILSDGDFFGEVALLDPNARSLGVVALERCDLLKLDAQAFAHFLVRHPDVHESVMQVARRRFRGNRMKGADAPLA